MTGKTGNSYAAPATAKASSASISRTFRNKLVKILMAKISYLMQIVPTGSESQPNGNDLEPKHQIKASDRLRKTSVSGKTFSHYAFLAFKSNICLVVEALAIIGG